MKEIIKILESEHNVSFQLILIDPESEIADNSVLKLCYSSSHKTRHLVVKLFYKRTF